MQMTPCFKRRLDLVFRWLVFECPKSFEDIQRFQVYTPQKSNIYGQKCVETALGFREQNLHACFKLAPRWGGYLDHHVISIISAPLDLDLIFRAPNR